MSTLETKSTNSKRLHTTDCTLIPGRQTDHYVSYQGVYYSKPALDEFKLKPTINTVFLYLLQSMEYKRYQDFSLFEITNLHQNIAIIISIKCANDLKCPFSADSQDCKHPFNLLSSACSYDVNRWHDKCLHIISVNPLLAAFIQ